MDEIEKRAREFAIARGITDPDHEIVCVGGVREPAWKFFRDEATEQVWRDQAARIACQAKATGCTS